MTINLAQELLEIEKEQSRIDGWENILASGNGVNAKFLKSELNRLMNDVRHLYVQIRADQPSVSQQLVALQSEEKAYARLLFNITDLQTCKNELDKRREVCNKYRQSEEVSEPLSRKTE